MLASFLNWFSVGGFGTNGWDFGLLGLFQFVIGAVIVGIALLPAVAPQVNLPDQVAGFSPNQLAMALAVGAFLWNFGLQFEDNSAIGLFLGWIFAAVTIAGGVMNELGLGGTSTTIGRPQDPPPPAQF